MLAQFVPLKLGYTFLSYFSYLLHLFFTYLSQDDFLTTTLSTPAKETSEFDEDFHSNDRCFSMKLLFLPYLPKPVPAHTYSACQVVSHWSQLYISQHWHPLTSGHSHLYIYNSWQAVHEESFEIQKINYEKSLVDLFLWEQ